MPGISELPRRCARMSCSSFRPDSDESGEEESEACSSGDEAQSSLQPPITLSAPAKPITKEERATLLFVNAKRAREYFVLYKELQNRPKYVPLFRQRNLSYMSHRLTDFLNNAEQVNNSKDKENVPVVEHGKKHAIRISSLDSKRGYKFASVDIFIVRQKKLQPGGEHRSTAIFYLGTLIVESFDNQSFGPSEDAVPIPNFEEIKMENSEFKYSTGVNIRLAKTRNRLNRPLLERSNENEKSDMHYFRGKVDNLKPALKIVSGKLFEVIDERKPTLPRNKHQWTDITDDYAFEPSGHLDNFIITLWFGNLEDGLLLLRPASQAPLMHLRKQPLSEIQNTMSNGQHASSPMQYTALKENYNKMNPKLRINIVNIQSNIYHSSYDCFICQVPCVKFEILMTHMKVCHSRFKFQFETMPEESIKISINEDFDGDDEVEAMQLTKCKTITKKRPSTSILVTNQIRYIQRDCNLRWGTNYELGEIRAFLGETPKRTYYHSQTCSEILPCEIDEDSEAENYRSWTIKRQVNLIDEFTDVNYGEKTLCKKWSEHCLKCSKLYVGNLHASRIAAKFLEWYRDFVFSRRLQRNLVLHFCNLQKTGFVTSSELVELINAVHAAEEAYKREAPKDESDDKVSQHN